MQRKLNQRISGKIKLLYSILVISILLSSCNKAQVTLYYDLGYIGGFNDGRDQAFLMQSYYKCTKRRRESDCRVLKRRIEQFERRFETIEDRLRESTGGSNG